MNKILVTLLALIGGSCISFAQMETGRVSDTAEDTLRIENEIVAVDTGFYQSVVRYDTVRYNVKMQSVYKKAFQLKNDVFVEKMKAHEFNIPVPLIHNNTPRRVCSAV